MGIIGFTSLAVFTGSLDAFKPGVRVRVQEHPGFLLQDARVLDRDLKVVRIATPINYIVVADDNDNCWYMHPSSLQIIEDQSQEG